MEVDLRVNFASLSSNAVHFGRCVYCSVGSSSLVARHVNWQVPYLAERVPAQTVYLDLSAVAF